MVYYKLPLEGVQGENNMTKKYTLEQYIQKANAIHDNKYDYSKTKYRGTLRPIEIVCPLHGEFSFCEAKVHTVLRKGCPKCEGRVKGRSMKLTIEHEKYHVKRVGKLQVEITCKLHPSSVKIIWLNSLRYQKPNYTFCKECKVRKQPVKKEQKVKVKRESTINTPSFIQRSIAKWGDRFSYNNTEYRGTKKPVSVICNTCNSSVYSKKAYLHFRDDLECNKCKKKEERLKNKETFITQANIKYGNKYDYSCIPDDFKLSQKVKIGCPQHGVFEQTPSQHMTVTFGCQICGAENSCGYSRTDYINKCNGREPILYLVHFELNGEEFYKIGITVNSISRRFRGYRSPYNHTLIDYIQGEAGFIFDTEKQIQKELNRYSYTPSLHMEGNTECFLLDTSVLASFQNLKQTIN